jgi:hypothetical protein
VRNTPVPVTRDELLDIIDDIRRRVSAGDSYEGSFEYLMPFDNDMEPIEGADFVVTAAYRVGNLQGQGGMRMIGKLQ